MSTPAIPPRRLPTGAPGQVTDAYVCEDVAALRRSIKARGLTIKRLAQTANVSEITVYRMLRRERVHIYTATKLCSALGIPLDRGNGTDAAA